jgi:hypothetical protein
MASRRFTAILMTPLVLAVAGWVGVPAASATSYSEPDDPVPAEAREWFAGLKPQDLAQAASQYGEDPLAHIANPQVGDPIANYRFNTGTYDLDAGTYEPSQLPDLTLDSTWYCAYVLDGDAPTATRFCVSSHAWEKPRGKDEPYALNFMDDNLLAIPAVAADLPKKVTSIASGYFALTADEGTGIYQLAPLDSTGATILGVARSDAPTVARELTRDNAEFNYLYPQGADGMPGPLLGRSATEIEQRAADLANKKVWNTRTQYAKIIGFSALGLIFVVIIAPKLTRKRVDKSRTTQ